MMKRKIITFLFLIFSFGLYAQSLEEDQTMVSAGYGIGSYRAWIWQPINNPLLSVISNNSSLLGPLYFKIEKMVDENTSYGLNVVAMSYNLSSTYTTSQNGINTTVTDKWNFISYCVLAKYNHHFTPDEALDFYTSVGLGYRYAKNTKIDGLTGNKTFGNFDDFPTIPVAFELTQGVRFLFTEQLGIYAEVGLAKSILQIGATYKF